MCQLWSFGFWPLFCVSLQLWMTSGHFLRSFDFDFVLFCTGLIAWKTVCRGKGLLLPALTRSNVVRQIAMKGFRMSFPEWSRFVRTTSPSTIVAHFHLIGVQEAVVGLTSFRHQTAALNPSRVNSTSLGSGVLSPFGLQIVMVLLATIEKTFHVWGHLEMIISFPSYHPNFPIGKFHFSSWLPSMHGFFVSSLFTRSQDLLSLLRFVAYCIVFLSYSVALFFGWDFKSFNFCCYSIFVLRSLMSQSLWFYSCDQIIPRYLLLRCPFHVTISPFNLVAVIRLCLPLFAFSWSFDVPWPVSPHSMRWKCLDPKK